MRRRRCSYSFSSEPTFAKSVTSDATADSRNALLHDANDCTGDGETLDASEGGCVDTRRLYVDGAPLDP